MLLSYALLLASLLGCSNKSLDLEKWHVQKEGPVLVIESGYKFLQLTKDVGNNKLYDDIEWGWKITVENSSKHDIYARGGYALLDKDGFILTRTNEDLKNKQGVLIKAGTKETIQGTAHWLVYSKSDPYTAKRVAKGNYELFLQYPNIDIETQSPVPPETVNKGD
jgi:hypothetical protein